MICSKTSNSLCSGVLLRVINANVRLGPASMGLTAMFASALSILACRAISGSRVKPRSAETISTKVGSELAFKRWSFLRSPTGQALNAWSRRQFDSMPLPSRGHGLAAEVGVGTTLGSERQPYVRGKVRWQGLLPLDGLRQWLPDLPSATPCQVGRGAVSSPARRLVPSAVSMVTA